MFDKPYRLKGIHSKKARELVAIFDGVSNDSGLHTMYRTLLAEPSACCRLRLFSDLQTG